MGALWRGALMGAADVVPGVSGGTMALVLGIYPRLLAALAAWTDRGVWRALLASDLRRVWGALDGPFMLALVLGLATSVITLAGVVETALQVARPQVYALFAGMIGASAWLLARQVQRWRPGVLLLNLGSLTVALVVVQLAPVQAPTGVVYLVFSGAIGISALLLPGISGAFLLMLLGQYEVVLGAIARADVVTLAPFAAGAAIGLFTFARVLHYGWRRYPDATQAAMAGFLVGSLPRIWPWQPTDVSQLVLEAPPTPWAALGAVLLLGCGALAVLGLQWQARQRQGNR
jgi:putative membrane protein